MKKICKTICRICKKYVKPFAICRIVTCSDFSYSAYAYTPHFADGSARPRAYYGHGILRPDSPRFPPGGLPLLAAAAGQAGPSGPSEQHAMIIMMLVTHTRMIMIGEPGTQAVLSDGTIQLV